MKSLKVLAPLGILMIIMMSSCSMGKRLIQSKSNLFLSSDVHSRHNGSYKYCSLCNQHEKGFSSPVNPIIVKKIETANIELDFVDNINIDKDDGIYSLAITDNSTDLFLTTNTISENNIISSDEFEILKQKKTITNTSIKKDIKENYNNSKPNSNDRSWIAAVLLCFFFGGLGIHRFYLGYTWQGVVQLLTAGGCGIWALIDFIRILLKDLKPKDGNYTD